MGFVQSRGRKFCRHAVTLYICESRNILRTLFILSWTAHAHADQWPSCLADAKNGHMGPPLTWQNCTGSRAAAGAADITGLCAHRHVRVPSAPPLRRLCDAGPGPPRHGGLAAAAPRARPRRCAAAGRRALRARLLARSLFLACYISACLEACWDPPEARCVSLSVGGVRGCWCLLARPLFIPC